MIEKKKAHRGVREHECLSMLCGFELMSCLFDHAIVECNDVIRSVSIRHSNQSEIETRMCNSVQITLNSN